MIDRHRITTSKGTQCQPMNLMVLNTSAIVINVILCTRPRQREMPYHLDDLAVMVSNMLRTRIVRETVFVTG